MKTETKTIYDLATRNTMYINCTFAVHADGAFLNGAGLSKKGENRNISTVKQYWKNKPIPYVSAQAWRRWLRNTLIEETQWNPSTIEPLQFSEKGSSSKIAGQLNPIDYPEDDIFGYMYKKGKTTKSDETERRLPEVQLVRKSPMRTTILRGVEGLTTDLREDQGFVHLKKGTPVPYTTEFYSSELVASFGLDVYRLGVYENLHKDKNELDPYLCKENPDLLTIEDHPIIKDGKVILRKDFLKHQNKLVKHILNALAILRGGSKQAQFAADVSPKLIILVGMKVGNILFDDLIVPVNNKPGLNIEAFKEIVSDYKDKITTGIYLGIREGYLENQDDIRKLKKIDGIPVHLGTPISIVNCFVKELE